ncbi:MAG: hypothetical protein ACREPY_06045 [Rhodanobacteraceae bacterium]
MHATGAVTPLMRTKQGKACAAVSADLESWCVAEAAAPIPPGIPVLEGLQTQNPSNLLTLFTEHGIAYVTTH